MALSILGRVELNDTCSANAWNPIEGSTCQQPSVHFVITMDRAISAFSKLHKNEIACALSRYEYEYYRVRWSALEIPAFPPPRSYRRDATIRNPYGANRRERK